MAFNLLEDFLQCAAVGEGSSNEDADGEIPIPLWAFTFSIEGLTRVGRLGAYMRVEKSIFLFD